MPALAELYRDLDKKKVEEQNLRIAAVECSSEASQLFEKIKETRAAQLESTLDKQGLAVCTRGYHSSLGETLKEMGVYPKEEMRLLWTGTAWKGSSEYKIYDEHLNNVCPEHFPETPNNVKHESDMPAERIQIECEIIEVEGEKYTLINKIPIKANVKRPSYPERLYRYFGLPELPKNF